MSIDTSDTNRKDLLSRTRADKTNNQWAKSLLPNLLQNARTILDAGFFMEYESMTAIQFIAEYTNILEEIDHLLHPDCYPAIRVMYFIDPHDLITPNAYFANREQAFGFVWKLLAAKVKELRNAN